MTTICPSNAAALERRPTACHTDRSTLTTPTAVSSVLNCAATPTRRERLQPPHTPAPTPALPLTTKSLCCCRDAIRPPFTDRRGAASIFDQAKPYGIPSTWERRAEKSKEKRPRHRHSSQLELRKEGTQFALKDRHYTKEETFLVMSFFLVLSTCPLDALIICWL